MYIQLRKNRSNDAIRTLNTDTNTPDKYSIRRYELTMKFIYD